MKYTSQEIVQWIAEFEPKFTKPDIFDSRYKIFTIPTQHISGENIEELIEFAIDRCKFSSKSDLSLTIEIIEEQDKNKPIISKEQAEKTLEWMKSEEGQKMFNNLMMTNVKIMKEARRQSEHLR